MHIPHDSTHISHNSTRIFHIFAYKHKISHIQQTQNSNQVGDIKMREHTATETCSGVSVLSAVKIFSIFIWQFIAKTHKSTK